MKGRPKLVGPNTVRGRWRWKYGIRVQSHNDGDYPVVEFVVVRDDGTRIGPLFASGYRTTALARRMGERELPGYQTRAIAAIDLYERRERSVG